MKRDEAKTVNPTCQQTVNRIYGAVWFIFVVLFIKLLFREFSKEPPLYQEASEFLGYGTKLVSCPATLASSTFMQEYYHLNSSHITVYDLFSIEKININYLTESDYIIIGELHRSPMVRPLLDYAVDLYGKKGDILYLENYLRNLTFPCKRGSIHLICNGTEDLESHENAVNVYKKGTVPFIERILGNSSLQGIPSMSFYELITGTLYSFISILTDDHSEYTVAVSKRNEIFADSVISNKGLFPLKKGFFSVGRDHINKEKAGGQDKFINSLGEKRAAVLLPQ